MIAIIIQIERRSFCLEDAAKGEGGEALAAAAEEEKVTGVEMEEDNEEDDDGEGDDGGEQELVVVGDSYAAGVSVGVFDGHV